MTQSKPNPDAAPLDNPTGGALVWFKYRGEWRKGRVAQIFGSPVTTDRVPVKHDALAGALSHSQIRSIYYRNRSQVFARQS